MKNIFHNTTADLYVRVSTDEQAYHGYSQRSQEDLLRRYCLTNNITVRKLILEDHSAKTFNRPEWKKYLTELKKTKCRVNLFLFVKWDRFSRNAGDAYQMISLLRKLGVEPQAIEQPLDLSIPENKIMLAIYLSTPEVENDRRAMNISHGMRQAQKEGRHISGAPYGYTNETNGLNRKYIAIVESEAEILRWAFEQVAQGIFNTEQIYKQAKLKGYTHSKANFWLTLRNPLYIGKIHVSSYKDEEAYWVKGQHTAIIDNSLFYKVQHVLDARRHSAYKIKVTSDELLPLRGFLICPLCAKKLTGSASRGAKKYYHYYHCVSPCKYRCRADCVNSAFIEEIRKFKPTFKMTEICRILINKSWALERNHFADQRKLLTNQINTIKDEIAYIRELLASHRLEPEEYREMKTAFNEKIASIESELLIIPVQNQNIDHILERALENLLMIDYIYENGELTTKRKIVTSIFPENLPFNGFLFRSNRINSLISIIFKITADLTHKRTRKKNSNTSDSISPIDTIQFPDFFVNDLKMLSLVSEL